MVDGQPGPCFCPKARRALGWKVGQQKLLSSCIQKGWGQHAEQRTPRDLLPPVSLHLPTPPWPPHNAVGFESSSGSTHRWGESPGSRHSPRAPLHCCTGDQPSTHSLWGRPRPKPSHLPKAPPCATTWRVGASTRTGTQTLSPSQQPRPRSSVSELQCGETRSRRSGPMSHISAHGYHRQDVCRDAVSLVAEGQRGNERGSRGKGGKGSQRTGAGEEEPRAPSAGAEPVWRCRKPQLAPAVNGRPGAEVGGLQCWGAWVPGRGREPGAAGRGGRARRGAAEQKEQESRLSKELPPRQERRQESPSPGAGRPGPGVLWRAGGSCSAQGAWFMHLASGSSLSIERVAPLTPELSCLP